ncbi:MAG: septal ring lytic transglycosylase RlpA family protein [Xanthobacteraceae bacterium]|nr:septal ring lytic transglycosylase RlpA family protein [Xanthobacteraceae bacterium]
MTSFTFASFRSLSAGACILASPVPGLPACSSARAAEIEPGIASIYDGGKTADGGFAYADGFTAAHRTLPFGTMVEVTNTRTGLSVIVRINDRGPHVHGRVIDLTPVGALAIGYDGLAPVTLNVLPAATGRGFHWDRSIDR